MAQVARWLYEDSGVCGFSKAGLLFWSNVLGLVVHLSLAIATVVVSTWNGRSMSTPELPVYEVNLEYEMNLTSGRMGLVPRLVQAERGLYLSHLTMWFFLLSAMAHGLVVVCNYEYRVRTRAPITVRRGWYFHWMHECRQPLRWVRSPC